jgi:hypothetical protein
MENSTAPQDGKAMPPASLGSLGLRPHFAEWLDSEGLREAKRRLRASATSTCGEGIEGVVLLDVPGYGLWRAVECDLTGAVRGTRYDMPFTENITVDYNRKGIEWRIVR